MEKLSLALAVFCLAANAEVVEVGFRDRGEIKVDAGASVTQSDRVSVDAHGRLAKTGEGDLKLSRDAILQSTPFKMDVLGGSVELIDGEKPQIDQPACLQQAAFWVDVSSANLVTTNGTGLQSSDCMKAWYDVRETDQANPSYPYAVPDWWHNETTYCLNYGVVPPCKTEAYGHAGLYFGGFAAGHADRNGQAALFMNPDGTQCDLQNIYHVFAVQAYSNSWGYIFGSWVSSNTSSVKDFHHGGDVYFSQRAGASVAMSTGNMYLDGVWIDGGTERPADHRGIHLLECELLNKLAHMQTFFRDSTWVENRGGGDYLYEVVIFTNKLSVAERASVRRYLMNRWDIPFAGAGATPTLALGPAGSVKVPVAEGEKTVFESDVNVKGDGSVVKTGTGDLEIPFDYAADAFAGPVDIRDGGVEFRRPLTVPTEDGTQYTVVSDARGNYVKKGTAAGGTVVKTGRGRIQFEGLPEGTTTLDVQGGVVKLCAPRIDLDRNAVTGSIAHIDDPSFESYVNDPDVSRAGTGRKYINTSGTLPPWTLVAQPDWRYTPAIAMYWMERFGSDKWPSHGYSAPDGSIAMYHKGDSASWVYVDIPADGRYEFSFYATARYSDFNGTGQNHIDLAIGEDLDHLTWFGNIIRICDPYTRFFYKTPYLTAGRHKLWFRSRCLGIDGTTTVDDLRMVRINDPEENVVKVPYGDFENVCDTNRVYLSDASKVEGWQFVNCWSAYNYAPAIVVTANSCSGNAGANMRMFDVGGTNTYGFAALGLFSTGGVARTTSTFTPPAGRYRLRADIGTWNVNFRDLTKEGDYAFNMDSSPHVAARVTVGEDVHELGEVSVWTQRNQPYSWAPVFETDGSQQVTIELWNTVARGGAEVDNLVLVPVTDGANILRNPSFESCSPTSGITTTVDDWTLAANREDFGSASGNTDAMVDNFDRDSANYALRELHEKHRLRLRGQGSASQDITLGDGLYRLKFYTYARHNPQGTDLFHYGMNPVRAYLSRGGVTNEIGWTLVEFTNYVETAFVFRSPGAGDYTFTLRGMATYGQKWNPSQTGTTDNLSLVDLVSIEKLDESKYAETPGLSADTVLNVAEDSRLELDFGGTNRVSRVRFGGRSVFGYISQATHPDYVSGPGTLYVEPRGSYLIFR